MDQTVSAQALRDSEELHRITLLSMSDAVFITDDNGLFTFICPNVDVIFGYSHEEVRAMERISRLLGRELVERTALTQNGEIRNIEHEISTKLGTRRNLLVHVKQVSIRHGSTLYVCRDVTERKQLEEAVARNEQRLTMALEAAGAGTWDWHVPTGEMRWSPETHRLLGDTSGDRQPSFDSFLDRVHQDDRDRVAETMLHAMERGDSYATEFSVRGYDDSKRWVMARGKAIRNGTPIRMLGVFVDFSRQHQIEQELREVGGRLINAHEQERLRISRELHDDVGQRMTILSLELERVRRQILESPSLASEQIAKLSVQTQEIGAALHRLSHELHPAHLAQLGLEESIRSMCDDVAKSRGIAMDFTSSNVGKVGPDASLCFYRVAQEALHNVIRHSQATRVAVALSCTSTAARLSVTDNGVGFDVRSASSKDALGLISMRERARLLQGHLSLIAEPGGGTRIDVTVPLTTFAGDS